MLLIKTQRGMEYIAANRIKERLPDVKIDVRPEGYLGLLIVHTNEKRAIEDIPEIERILPIYITCKADLNEILSKAEEIVNIAKPFKTFAVRTKRRGRMHNFTSMDVSVSLGAKIKELTDADVDLLRPEKAIYVEIINRNAYISIISGEEERKKYTPEKVDARKFFGKISVVQLPYLGEFSAAKEMGKRIGRAAQSFEIKELIIAPFNYVNAFELMAFIQGLEKGQKSRLEIQRKAYDREVHRVPIYLQDMYQVVRDKRRKGNIIIVTDPTGKQIVDVKDKLKKDLLHAKEVVVFIGSRQGIPKGIFKFADYIIDLAPYITFATEQAIPAALIALLGVYEENFREHEKNSENGKE